MCEADSNLEYRRVNEEGGITASGYGEHRCRDYHKVFNFAEEWRVWEGKSAVAKTKISESQNVPNRVINYDYVSSRGDSKPP